MKYRSTKRNFAREASQSTVLFGDSTALIRALILADLARSSFEYLFESALLLTLIKHNMPSILNRLHRLI